MKAVHRMLSLMGFHLWTCSAFNLTGFWSMPKEELNWSSLGDILYDDRTDTIYGQFVLAYNDYWSVGYDVYQLAISKSANKISTKTVVTSTGLVKDLRLSWNVNDTSPEPSIVSWQSQTRNPRTRLVTTDLNGQVVKEKNIADESLIFSQDGGIAFSSTNLMRWDPLAQTILWNRQITSKSTSLNSVYLSLSTNSVYIVAIDGSSQEKIIAVNYETGSRKQDPPKFKSCPTGWSIKNLLWETNFQILVCYSPFSTIVQRFSDFQTPIFWNSTYMLEDSIFTGQRLFMSLRRGSSFCFILLSLELQPKDENCDALENVGETISTWRLSKDRLHKSWGFWEEFRFKNQVFPWGAYIIEVQIDSDDIHLQTIEATSTSLSKPVFTSLGTPSLPQNYDIPVIVIPSVVVVFIILLLSYFLRIRAIKSRAQKDLTTSLTQVTLSTHLTTLFQSQIPLSVPGYLELASYAFRLETVIARGGFGEVYLVELLDKQLISRVRTTKAVAKFPGTKQGLFRKGFNFCRECFGTIAAGPHIARDCSTASSEHSKLQFCESLWIHIKRTHYYNETL